MTARCPLVREIEEASKRCLAAGPASDNAQDPLPWTEAEWDADQIVASEAWWPRLRAALEATEEIDKTLNDGISAVQDVLQAAYHRCFLMCCGRPGYDCCGSPAQSWSAEDQRIMDVLGPIEKQMREALARYRAATRTEE